MRFKNRLALLMAAVVVIVGLVACGGSDDGDGATVAAQDETAASQEETAFDAAGDVPFDGPETEVADELPDPEEAGLKVAFLSPRASNESLSAIEDGIRVETENLGGEFLGFDAALDVGKQVSQFEQALAQRVDAIGILPLDPRALAPSLKRAKQLGIPVIGSAVDPANPDGAPGYEVDVWEGHDRLAYEQVKEMAKRLPPQGKVVLIGSVIPVPALELTSESQERWAKAFGLEVLGRVNNPTDDIAGGQQAMTEALSSYPDAQGILPYNDDSGVGANAAARAANKRDDLVIVGINGGSLGFGAVEDGSLQATIQTQEIDVGVLMAKAMFLAVQGEPLPPVVIPPAPIVVTPENVGEVDRWEDQLAAREAQG